MNHEIRHGRLPHTLCYLKVTRGSNRVARVVLLFMEAILREACSKGLLTRSLAYTHVSAEL